MIAKIVVVLGVGILASGAAEASRRYCHPRWPVCPYERQVAEAMYSRHFGVYDRQQSAVPADSMKTEMAK